MSEFWNKRYSGKEFVYGKEPNEFFRDILNELEPGRILLLGEGEGRNAVYAASKGWDVDAVDFSEEGKRKAELLAEEKGVKINYIVTTLEDFDFGENSYDVVASIFVHLAPENREVIHASIFRALKPQGNLILEAFGKEQLEKASGGPKDEEMLYSLEDIFYDFQDMDFRKFEQKTIELNEGKFHRGEAEVIRLHGTKEF